MPPELLQAFGNLTSFAIGALVVLAAIWKIPPAIDRNAKSNDRLAASNDRHAETDLKFVEALSGLERRIAASENALGELAVTNSDFGSRSVYALDLIAKSLDTAMQRQAQFGQVVTEARDVSNQTLAIARTVGGQVGELEETIETTLGKVLDVKDIGAQTHKTATDALTAIMTVHDKLEDLISRPMWVVPEDMKPLKEAWDEAVEKVVKAIESKNDIVPLNALAFEDHRDSDGNIRTTVIVDSGAPPADELAGELKTDSEANKEQSS